MDDIKLNKPSTETACDLISDSKDPCVELSNLTAHWNTDNYLEDDDASESVANEKTPLLSRSSGTTASEKDTNGRPVLDDVSFQFSGKGLVAVVGPVGSSKVRLKHAPHTK